jgi:hypothetical protein
MGIIPDASYDATAHPDWCDRSRCQYPRNAGSKFGHHRSEPMTLGRVTVVLTQAPDASRPSLEVNALTRLVPSEGDAGILHAMFVLMSVDAAVQDCARLAREWQNDHSMRDHTSRFSSTPNHVPGGDFR